MNSSLKTINIDIILAIDLKKGKVVRAFAGFRFNYKPLRLGNLDLSDPIVLIKKTLDNLCKSSFLLLLLSLMTILISFMLLLYHSKNSNDFNRFNFFIYLSRFGTSLFELIKIKNKNS